MRAEPLLGDHERPGRYFTEVSIFKAIVGSGGLALPKALGDMGVAPFVLTMLAVWALSDCALGWLATAAKDHPGAAGMHELVERVLGPRSALCVDVLHLFYSLGSCCAYVAFVQEALCHVLRIRSAGPESGLPAELVRLLIGLVCTALLAVRGWHPRAMGAISFCGSVAILLGYLVAAGASLEQFEQQSQPPPLFTDTQGYFESAGKVVFLFCAHFTLATLIDGNASEFRQAGRRAMAVAAVVNLVFGLAVGMLAYPHANSVIYTSFSGWFVDAAAIAVSLDLICTFPLPAKPGLLLLERAMPRGAANVVLGISATIISKLGFGVVITVAGAVTNIAGAFVFPPLLMIGMGAARCWWPYVLLVAMAVFFAEFTVMDELSRMGQGA